MMHSSKNVKSPTSCIFIRSFHFRQPFLSVSFTFSQPSETFRPLRTLYFFTKSVPYPSENSALTIFTPSFTQHLTHFALYSSCPFLLRECATSFCHTFDTADVSIKWQPLPIQYMHKWGFYMMCCSQTYYLIFVTSICICTTSVSCIHQI